jgi:glycerophosphoryl diester phosphodiesterase
MRAALALARCDGLEFDLRAARDGTPILLHDETLDRTHGRPERPEDLGVDELAAIGVPTFEAVLTLVSATAFLDVEVKSDVAPALGRLLRPWIARGGRAIVSSFEHEVLASLRRELPDVPRWLNSEVFDEATLTTASGLGCEAVSVRWQELDRDGPERARAVGLDVAVWTVTEPGVLECLESIGIVASCVEGAALDA